MEVLMEKAGGPEKARALINAAEPRNGKTALHLCGRKRALRHGGVSPQARRYKNALSGSKQTALHLATLAGCLPTVRTLVEHGAQILFTAAEAKSSKVPASPLHLAAASHSEALVSLFVELGLDINLTDAAGRIPLHFAPHAVPKNEAFIDFLLARGANAKAVDEEGQGVLHYAITNDESVEMVAMCRRLIAAGADGHFNDPILCLAKILSQLGEPSYSVDLVNLFVDHGLNIKDPRIGTALLTAAAGAFSYDLAVVLLDHGVDPNASVGTEMLPLHQAVFHQFSHRTADRRRVVELLLARGADPNRPAGLGQQPALFWSGLNDSILDLLLSHGADINARTGHGETFLFSTVSRSWPRSERQPLPSLKENVVALIKRGADPEQCRVNGRGPVSEVGVHPTDTLIWEWVAFLRSVGIPVQTAADDEPAAAAEAGHHHDDPARPGEEGMA